MKNDLLPYRTAESIGQVVHLVHHDEAEGVQSTRTRVQHVAQDLGGHHHDRGIAVDRGVAREQSHARLAVLVHEVAVLLVAQCLDGGGVEGALTLAQGEEDSELTHHGLSRTRGGRHEDGSAAFDAGTPCALEVIQRIGQGGGELAGSRLIEGAPDAIPLIPLCG